MLLACKNLEQTLKEITRCIVEGEMGRMDELLSHRISLIEEIQAAEPSREEAPEVEDILKSVISLEQLITGLARDKKKEIMEEIREIKSRKRAHKAYGNQSLKGVRP